MAESYVAERVRKGFGPVRIRQELRQRGLPDAIIEPHLAKSEQEWSSLMSALYDRRFGHTPPVDVGERARRARFLEYRGFPRELIAGLLHDEGGL
jgi:regulatory protein